MQSSAYYACAHPVFPRRMHYGFELSVRLCVCSRLGPCRRSRVASTASGQRLSATRVPSTPSYFSHCASIYIDRLVGSYVWSINRNPARPPPNENTGYALVDDYLVHDGIGTALGEVARRGTACRFAGQECLPSWPDVVYCLVAGWPGGSRVSASGTIARPLLRAGDGTWPWPRRRLPVGHPSAGASTGTCAQDRTFSPPRTTSLSQFV